ncbi:MAG: DNRLRE domain-containing protein, partial [Oscillospiraceae bacterium]|nr:DNRLRE domain-containing protein [Oscillospiraceae bacterium]
IPANTTITSAALALTLRDGQSTWSNISVFPANTDWTSTLCWAVQPSIGTALAENVAPSNMLYTTDVTAAVRSWYTGADNHGVMVRYHNESVNDYNSFYSSDVGDRPPSLTINYENTADLQVASINAPSGDVGNSLNISAVISNTGAAAAGASTVQYVIKDSGGTTVHTATASCGSVAAGASVTAASISWTPVTADTYTVTVTADYFNVIPESDENNNTMSAGVTVGDYYQVLNWFYPLTPASGGNINIISPYNRGNPGFAVECNYGVPVYAIDNGTVLATGYDDLKGNYVAIKTNSIAPSGQQYIVWYTHLQTIDVNVNATVVKGTTVIGKTGTTGLSPFPRLGLYISTANTAELSLLNISNTVDPVRFWDYWGSSGHFIFGDINGDGQANEFDLASLREHLLRKNLLSGSALVAADMNEDDKVDILDLLILKRYLLENTRGDLVNEPSQEESSSAASTSSAASSSSSASSGTSTSSSTSTSVKTDSDGFGPPYR